MQTTDEKRPELKDVTSLKDLAFEGDVLTLDLTEDAWAFGAPPPRGVYDVKMYLAKEAWKQGHAKGNEKDIFLQANLECKIVSENEDYNGSTVFGRVDSRIFRGKSISTMAGLLVKMGYQSTLDKEAGKLTVKKLAQYFELAMKKEPVIKAELDWKGSYSYRTPKGEEAWENHFKHWDEFPDAEDKPGEKKHIVSVSSKGGGSAEVKAQLFIVRFFGKGDELPKFETGGGKKLVSAPKLISKQVVAAEEKVVAATAKAAAAAEETDDLNLMLV